MRIRKSPLVSFVLNHPTYIGYLLSIVSVALTMAETMILPPPQYNMDAGILYHPYDRGNDASEPTTIREQPGTSIVYHMLLHTR